MKKLLLLLVVLFSVAVASEPIRSNYPNNLELSLNDYIYYCVDDSLTIYKMTHHSDKLTNLIDNGFIDFFYGIINNKCVVSPQRSTALDRLKFYD